MKNLPLPSIILTIIIFVSLFLSGFTSKPDAEKRKVFIKSNIGERIELKNLVERALSFRSDIIVDKQQKLVFPRIPPRKNPPGKQIAPNIIIGNDDRVQVGDTSAFPWSTISYVEGKFNEEAFRCTGWILGTSTLVTSAHCIYDYGDTNVFATDVIIIPGQNIGAPNPEPFGRCSAHQAWIIEDWELHGNSIYDYGVYILNCRIGELTGNLGFRTVSDVDILGADVIITGYPADKPSGTMWFGSGNIVGVEDAFLSYNNDTTGGQSGSPVWEPQFELCELCTVAIHRSTDGIANYGVRVNDEVFDFLISLQTWVYQPPLFIPIAIGSENQENVTQLNPYPAPTNVKSNSLFSYPPP